MTDQQRHTIDPATLANTRPNAPCSLAIIISASWPCRLARHSRAALSLAAIAMAACTHVPAEQPVPTSPPRAGPPAPIVPIWAELIESTPDPAVVPDADFRAAIRDAEFAWRVRDRRTGIEMLLVPPGAFLMGCSPSKAFGCDDSENPRHQVILTKPFYLGRYEVTQSQWLRMMGSNPSRFQGLGDPETRPVDNVSWDDIQGFLSASGLRLPTEAQWEFACRANATTAFPNGSDDDSVGAVAWVNESPPDPAAGYASLAPHDVGLKTPNALGLHDMLGNVMEWVNDWFDPAYYERSPRFDPPGPESGTHRVIRGGALAHKTSWVRSSSRNAGTPEIKGTVLGFRAAKDP